MTYIEFIELIKDYYSIRLPISYNSVINTLKEIGKKEKFFNNIVIQYNHISEIGLIALQYDDYNSPVSNIWFYFIDKSNIVIFQIYDMRPEYLSLEEYNLNINIYPERELTEIDKENIRKCDHIGKKNNEKIKI